LRFPAILFTLHIMIRATGILTLSLTLLTACAMETRPMKTVDYVDLERFMGDWYVVANIPTVLERGAHNAVESYELTPDGTIKTTFTFRAGSFDGEEKTYHPTGYVLDTTTNARWGMQFVWPIKADYRVILLDDDYRLTIIGRQKRDYVWVMSRDPVLSDADYGRVEAFLEEVGYDTAELQRVPQRWREGGASDG
jgi:apolipoprotein D and lipocalin family protein